MVIFIDRFLFQGWWVEVQPEIGKRKRTAWDESAAGMGSVLGLCESAALRPGGSIVWDQLLLGWEVLNLTSTTNLPGL